MFLLPEKARSSILGAQPKEEQLSSFCKTPDLDSLCIRVARLDAAVSIATRRNAEVESMVTNAEKWIDSKLEEVATRLQDRVDSRVEDMVRRLVTQLLSDEPKNASEISTEGPPSSRETSSEVSVESDLVSTGDSTSSSITPKPRARKLVSVKRRQSKPQIQAPSSSQVEGSPGSACNTQGAHAVSEVTQQEEPEVTPTKEEDASGRPVVPHAADRTTDLPPPATKGASTRRSHDRQTKQKVRICSDSEGLQEQDALESQVKPAHRRAACRKPASKLQQRAELASQGGELRMPSCSIVSQLLGLQSQEQVV